MSDQRTLDAIAHWAPRFVSNGVPLYDFELATAEVTEWSSWCATWVDRGRVHDALADVAAERGNMLTAGEHWRTAALCYHFGKFVFVEHYEEMRAAHELAVAAYSRALPYLDPPGVRVEVPYEGRSLAGVLRLPRDVAGPVPVVLMVAGLDSTKEEMGTYEEPFLRRGLATFAFDGPGQGEAEYEIPMRHDFEVPVSAVIDHLGGVGSVDVSRLGIFGVSLGGHYVVRATAFEPRIRACASISGSYRVPDSWETRPAMSKASYRVRAHLQDEEETRAFVQDYDLSDVAHRINVPFYVVAGTKDRLTPHTGGERMASEAQGPTILDVVEDGNHVVNNMPYRYRPQVADWMHHLL